MRTSVRWYVAYPLSLRHLEEMMSKRAVSGDHSTVHRWAIKLLLALGETFRPRKRGVGRSWRMVVEQDHRAIKRVTRPALGFKDFHCARVILSGIELMNMIKKGQVKCQSKTPLSPARQFYSLV